MKLGKFDDSMDNALESIRQNDSKDNVLAFVHVCSFALPKVLI